MITAEQTPHPILQFRRILRDQRGIERSFTTILRWIKEGVTIKGVTYKLDSKTIGSAYHVTLEQYDRFVEETTQARLEA